MEMTAAEEAAILATHFNPSPGRMEEEEPRPGTSTGLIGDNLPPFAHLPDYPSSEED